MRLTPVAPSTPRRPGSTPELKAWADAILEPLPEEELTLWEGRG